MSVHKYHIWKSFQKTLHCSIKDKLYQFELRAILEDFLPKCNTIARAYSRPLLGVTITPNLVLRVLKKIFLLEMVKGDICLKGASKQNTLFSKNVLQKMHPCPRCLE